MTSQTLVDCKACQGPISRRAMSCPKCGHPNDRVALRLLAALLVTMAIAFAFFSWRSSVHVEKRKSAQMAVLAQLIEGYKSDSQHGRRDRACVTAIQIAGLYSQIDDQARFKEWDKVQSRECRRPPA